MVQFKSVAAERRRAKPKPDVLSCVFFKTEGGAEPVRDWLRDDIPTAARKTVGSDIKTVQATWPIGLPLVDSLGGGLWEVRSTHQKVEYRTIFMIDGSTMVLLHGFEEHSKKTSKADLDLANQRKNAWKRAR